MFVDCQDIQQLLFDCRAPKNNNWRTEKVTKVLNLFLIYMLLFLGFKKENRKEKDARWKNYKMYQLFLDTSF